MCARLYTNFLSAVHLISNTMQRLEGTTVSSDGQVLGIRRQVHRCRLRLQVQRMKHFPGSHIPQVQVLGCGSDRHDVVGRGDTRNVLIVDFQCPDGLLTVDVPDLNSFTLVTTNSEQTHVAIDKTRSTRSAQLL